jgi:hypothetical protein
MDGASNIGSPQTLIGGVASVSTSSLSVAVHTISAAYGGDGVWCPKTVSISYEITAVPYNPCNGHFTAGNYKLSDPVINSLLGDHLFPFTANINGVGTVSAGCSVPAFATCSAQNSGITYTTSCANLGAGPVKLTVTWCQVVATGCFAVSGPPSCPGGSGAVSFIADISSGSSTTMSFTVPSGLPSPSPWTPGQTITIS